MTPTSNVVEIHSNRVPPAVRPDLPPLLNQVRELSHIALQRSLKHFFDNLDDALFELADRSRSDADQQMYFDSMREMRICRTAVERDFLLELDNRYFQLPSPAQPAEAPSEDDPSFFESLTLVRNDELEISVAVAGIVSKIASRYSLQLTQLTRRFDALCPKAEVRERDNPVGPLQLCDCFTAATQQVQVDIKVRIILLKLFERMVMEQLGPLYDDTNRVLAEAGVLRNLRDIFRVNNPDRSTTRRVPENSRAAGGAPTSHAPQGQQTADDGDANWLRSLGGLGDLGTIERVLANQRWSSSVSYSGPVLTQSDVLNLLAQVQLDWASRPIDLGQSPTGLDLRPLIVERAANAGVQGRGFAGHDEDVVNLVGMVFDYILNDRNLAIPMKALLARLQIPYLKLALMDKRFFSQSGHPARLLLNELSSAGIGWSSSAELKRDNLYDLIESVVVKILHQFERDQEVFRAALEELRSFRQLDEKRNKVVEQRIRDTETGRSKARAARDSVRQYINQKAAGLNLPNPVRQFVRETWSKVLLFLCIRNGTDSTEWQQATQCLDELFWCAQTLHDADLRQERESLLPRLFNQLADGVLLIGAEQSTVQVLRTDFERRIERTSATSAAAEAELNPDSPAGIVETDDEPPVAVPDVAPQWLQRADRLAMGTWIEFVAQDGQTSRAKLTTTVDGGKRFVFVNRRGMKVAERGREELALALSLGKAIVIEERQLFERALERVISNLREKHA